MAKFYRTVSFLLWLLGLVTMVAAVLWRLAPRLRITSNFEMRSLLLAAGVFFLGAIATWAMERTAPS
jgi:hypothetical protein